MREHYDEKRLDPMLFLVADLCPRATPETPAWLERLELRGEEHRATGRLAGDLTIAEIVRRSRDQLAAKRALACLRAVDAIDLVPASLAASPPPETVVVRPAEVAPSPAPRGSHGTGAPLGANEPARANEDAEETPEERLERAAGAAIRIARAVGRSLPPPPGERRSRLTAEQSFERGVRHAANGAWALAKKDFERAYRLMPNAIEYELHASHAAVAAGEPDQDRDAALDGLDALAARALVIDKKLAFAHYARGIVALHKGRDDAALPFFREAARLDPSHVDAARHARLLAKRLGDR
jgi:tetratricopeptide (TPR) repeat protein